ncbi:MAG: DUF2726 domain-containing protein [Phycisphaeraceae bacterium]|nr:DUF2726 domain-containing protein [Phycisphaeraceae bacterium]
MTLTYILLILGLFAIGIALKLLAAWLETQKRGTHSDDSHPYVPRDFLLTPGERAFFPALAQACAHRSLIFPQVQLSKFIYPRAGIPKRQTYQNKIDRKSVDFLLCNPSTLAVELIIELDDKSHTREDRKSRDDFVNNALKAAGIPLLRIPAASNYNPADLEQRIRQAINPAPKP